MNSFECMFSVRYLIASVLCATCCSMPHLVNFITGAEQRQHHSTTQNTNNNNSSGVNSNNEQPQKSFPSISQNHRQHQTSKHYPETVPPHYAKLGQSLGKLEPQQLKLGTFANMLSVNEPAPTHNGSLTNMSSISYTSSSESASSSNMTVNKTVANILNGSSNIMHVEEDFSPVTMLPPEDIAVHKDLPLPLLIASPVAAVSIIIFVCIAYYCHSSQLDARARQLALKYAVISTEPPVCSRGVPSTSSVDMDLISKPSLRPSTSRTSTPNQTPDGSKRGSINWVAIGDQEVITYTAARRHSTFIL
ncbi:hypothetical protein Ahia01_000673500 [Argonauta hians]